MFLLLIIFYLFLIHEVLGKNWWNLKCSKIEYPQDRDVEINAYNNENVIEEKNLLLLAYTKDSRLRTSGIFLRDNSSIKTRCNWYDIQFEQHYSEIPTITVMNKCNLTDGYMKVSSSHYHYDWRGMNYKCEYSDQLTVMLQVKTIIINNLQFYVIQFCSNNNSTEFGLEYWIFIFDSHLLKSEAVYSKLNYYVDDIFNDIQASITYGENININLIKTTNHLKSQCNCSDSKPIVKFNCRSDTLNEYITEPELNVTDFFYTKTDQPGNGIINNIDWEECKMSSPFSIVAQVSFICGIIVLIIIAVITVNCFSQ